jgi:hypothetical protein
VLASNHTKLSSTYTMVMLLVIFKTRRLLNVYFFIDVAIEKCTLDIHLIELDVLGTVNGH